MNLKHFALAAAVVPLVAFPAPRNFRCYVSDAGKSETVQVPFNTIKDIALQDGKHILQLNNYEGALMLLLSERGGAQIAYASFDGRMLTLRFPGLNVFTECRPEKDIF